MAGRAPKIEFSLLDFGFRDSSLSSIGIIEDVLEYAVTADRLGFKRIWLSEHHISDSLAAWYNPYPVIPLIGGMTEHIRIGVAGTQLNLHDPYHLALDFKLLANLFSERVDLGIAGGNPPDNIGDYTSQSNNNFYEKRVKLLRLLQREDDLAVQEELIIPPFRGEIPEIWFLGSDYGHLEAVLEHGVSFSRSLFHGNDLSYSRERLDEFREAYRQRHNRQPNLTLAISGCCHHTDHKARTVAQNAGYYGITAMNVVGSAARFKETVLEYQELYGISEFTFLNVARTPQDRRTGLELIQKSFGLKHQ